MKNKQEKILQHLLDTMGNNQVYSNYELILRIRDCFTIQRIENEIQEAIHYEQFDRTENLYTELNTLLEKYDHILKEKEDQE